MILLSAGSMDAKLTKAATLSHTKIGTLIVARRCHLEQNVGRSFMGSTNDKIKGNANEAIGKAKQGIGEATGSERLQGEGAVQEVKGKGQQAMGDAKDAAKDAISNSLAVSGLLAPSADSGDGLRAGRADPAARNSAAALSAHEAAPSPWKTDRADDRCIRASLIRRVRRRDSP